MSQDAVEKVLGRLLTDDAFRRRAARGVADACRAEGYQLTEGELLAIRREDLDRLEALAKELDASIKRFCRNPGDDAEKAAATGKRKGVRHESI